MYRTSAWYAVTDTGGYQVTVGCIFSVPVQAAHVYFHSPVYNPLVPWGAGCNSEHFPSEGVPVFACYVLVCAWCTCMCMHSLQSTRTHLEAGIITLLLSLGKDGTMMSWQRSYGLMWVFQSQNRYTDYLNSFICIVLPFCHGFYSLFFVTIQTNSFIPSPPTLAFTVTALWA